MKHCPTCGTPLQPASRFCHACGERLWRDDERTLTDDGWVTGSASTASDSSPGAMEQGERHDSTEGDREAERREVRDDAPEYSWRLGAYRIGPLIGGGSFGMVYKARAEFSDDPIAVKLIREQDIRSLRALRSEFSARSRIESYKHVVRAWQPVVAQSHLVTYVIYPMELLDGDLRSIIGRLQKTSPGMREELVAARWLPQICRGVYACHQAGILHLDIKPGNILLDVPTALLKVSDFGISRVIRGESSRPPRGTAGYAAPEQRIGASVDERTDVFAVGLVAAELSTGSRNGVYEIEDRRLRSVVEKATQHEPAQRFQSMTEFLDALEGQAVGEASVSLVSDDRPPVTQEDPDRETHRIPLLSPGGAVATNLVGAQHRNRHLVIRDGVVQDIVDKRRLERFRDYFVEAYEEHCLGRYPLSRIGAARTFSRPRVDAWIAVVALIGCALGFPVGAVSNSVIAWIMGGVGATYVFYWWLILALQRERNTFSLRRYGFWLVTDSGEVGPFFIRKEQIPQIRGRFGDPEARVR